MLTTLLLSCVMLCSLAERSEELVEGIRLREEVAAQESLIDELVAQVDAAVRRRQDPVPVPVPDAEIPEKAFDRVYQAKNIVGANLFFTFVVIIIASVALGLVAHVRKLVANPRGSF